MMANELQPLVSNQKIANPDGTPTDYFIRWAQQRQIDIQNGINAEQAQQLINDWAAQRDIIAGNGLNGGGPLSSDVTLNVGAGIGIDVSASAISLEDTAVVPGVYGDATNVAQITVDQQGRITNVVNVPITGGGGGGAPPTLVGATVVWVNNSNSVNVALPAGTVAGDLVVYAANNGWSVNTPSGFTSLSSLPGSNTNGAASYKTLTAADIAAGFIVGTFSNSYFGAAGIMVFAGATVTLVTLGVDARNTGSTGTVPLVTPLSVNPRQTAVIYGGARGNGAVSFATATSAGNVANVEGSAAMGYYTPTATAPYADTITFANDPSGNYGVIIVVTGT